MVCSYFLPRAQCQIVPFCSRCQKFSTLIAVFTLDRLGRRVTLYWGNVVMGISMFLSGGFSALAQQNLDNESKRASYGAAGAAFTFVFTAGFGATWLTVPWLYPAEIFPLQVRAKGNAWGVAGWSIGNGWTVCFFSPFLFISPTIIHPLKSNPVNLTRH